MGSDNKVRIIVCDENNVEVNLSSDWTVEPGVGTSLGKEGDEVLENSLEPASYAIEGERQNIISLEIDIERKGSELVAKSYMNAGYGTDVKEWPDSGSIPVNEEGKHSANIAVDGEPQAPKKMNFYFPLTIKTPAGFAMELLLGQSHHADGLAHTLADLTEAAEGVFEGCADAVAGKVSEAKQKFAKFSTTMKDIFVGENPWHVTVKGTEEYPAAIIEGTAEAKKARLLFCGPTSSQKKQAGTFDPNLNDGSGQNYTFYLKISEEYAKEVPALSRGTSG